MSTVRLPVAFSAALLWIGFVCAISFMEAWLKFRAPGITMAQGLGIGRLVFNALNKVEWAWAILIFLQLLFSKTPFFTLSHIGFFIASALLLVQTFWLLPALDARAQLQLEGLLLPASLLHVYYVGMEVIKVAALLLFGFSLFKSSGA